MKFNHYHLLQLLINSKNFSRKQKTVSETKQFLECFCNKKLSYELNDNEITYLMYLFKKHNLIEINEEKVKWVSNKNLNKLLDKIENEVSL